MAGFSLGSDAFQHEQPIPEKYGCKGENINPQLTISNVPENTEALAMIMDDPDAPVGTFTHWTVWNIDPKTALIPENTSIGTEGANDFGDTGYGGPCPPSGTHRYFFKLYALSEKLQLPPGASRQQLEQAMEGKILQQTQLMGTYSK